MKCIKILTFPHPASRYLELDSYINEMVDIIKSNQ